MSIGIIGSGALGGGFARALALKNIPALISSQRGPDSLREVVVKTGPSIKPASVSEAAQADIVLIAVPWLKLSTALRDLPSWNNRIVIDASNPVKILTADSPEAKDPSNPLASYLLEAIDLQGEVSSVAVAKLVPGARVVKAFNHLEAALLADPKTAVGPRVMFYCGDEPNAKAEVARLIKNLDLFGVDLGSLAAGGRLTQFPFGPLSAINFIKA